MENPKLTIRIDENDKKSFEEFCKKAGMNVTTAINLFIKTVIREQSLPFEIKLEKGEKNNDNTEINLNELEKIKEKALEDHIPIIMDDTLEKIKEILETEMPNRILEIGTAVGYSASRFVQYAPNAVVDTIELDETRAKEAIENIKKIGISENVNVMIGNATQILPTLTEKYDMIFIDANKGKYPIFLEEAIRLSKKGSIIVADNILYKGYVMSDYNKHKQRTAVRHLREYIQMATENENLDTEILEVGDGIAISRVKK